MGPEGWLRCIAHPFGGGVCRAHVEYTVFAPGSLEVAVWCVGFFGFCFVFLYLFVHNLPQLACTYGEGNGTPLQYSCLENPMDGEAW